MDVYLRPETQLAGRRLAIARVVWIVMASLALMIFAVGANSQLHKPLPTCTLPGDECGPWIISREDIQLGEELGLPGDLLYLIATVGLWSPRLVLIGVAALIFWRRSSDWIALLMSSLLMVGILEGIEDVGRLAPIQAVLYSWTIALFALIPFIFPTGSFIPRWSLWVAPPLTIAFVMSQFWPHTIGFVALIWFAVAGYAVIYRYRRVLNPVERQQSKWVMMGLLGSAVIFIPTTISAFFYAPTLPTPDRLIFMFLVYVPTYIGAYIFAAFCIAVAIFRYRLWDIDIVINRVLVYGALTLCTMAIYTLVVGYIGDLFQGANRSGLVFLAAGLVALLFQPIHLRLQRIVDHLIYGERDNPAQVLANLGKSLESVITPDAVLPTVVESIALALRLPYAAVMVNVEERYVLAAEHGQRPTSKNAIERFPLNYRNEPIGFLLASKRGGEEHFGKSDRALLENIAAQVSVAVYAVQVTRDLQRSRERLVTAREEERRRIRRDLHDGLGPTLASLTLKLDTARNQLKQNPDSADALLVELKSQTKGAIESIRSLVYSLRPPALDELGLISATQAYAANHVRAGLAVRIEVVRKLPKLSAAVEVAAYRIICEALMNASKHSQATECEVKLYFDRGLHIEVQDNGVGLPETNHKGVGMFSMRERAAELGGTLGVRSSGSGVCVTASLPCEVGDES